MVSNVYILRGVLNSSLSAREKLAKIEEIVERAEYIDRLATEHAFKRGRKPNLQDRIIAIKQIEKEKKIRLLGSDRLTERQETRLKRCLRDGIKWMKKTIREQGNWRIRPKFEPYIVKEKPLEKMRPISVLSVAPWEISLAILTLRNWLEHFDPRDNEATDLIVRGKAYLRQVQLAIKNGGVGDSLWFKGVRSRNLKSLGNTLETCVTISAWDTESENLSSAYKEAIELAVSYILGNRKEGGFGFKKGWNPDLKSTAIALMVLTEVKARHNLSLLNDRDFERLRQESLEWITGRQQENGSWKYQFTTRDSSIFCSFYAIEALTQQKLLYQVAQSSGLSINHGLNQKIDLALRRALKWYESSQQLIKNGDKEGWGWKDHSEVSGVENTAAGLIVLLDAAWISETSPLVERTLEWLINQMDRKDFWVIDTPLVLLALIRVLKPESRLSEMVKNGKT